MTPAHIEFARALEAVCRQLNPPHRPLPPALSLDELGLAGLRLEAGDPLLAYRYVRGLELPGPLPARSTTSLWALEPGLVEAASVAVELAPGLLAVGDVGGFVRLFSRRGRGRWESVAALPSHDGMVNALLPLSPTQLMSAGADGLLVIWSADGRGRWRAEWPGLFAPQPGPLQALCRMRDGSVVVAGSHSWLGQLQTQPSGDWLSLPMQVGAVDAVALAAYGDGGFAALLRDGSLQVWRAGPLGFTLAVPQEAPPGVGDIVPWPDGGLAIGCASGDVRLMPPPSDTASPLPAARVQRLSPSPIRVLRRLGDDGLITWSDGGQLRIWRSREGGFQRLAEFDAVATPRPCFASLCDGRVAFADHRGLVLAAPDNSGVWRSDELLSSYDAGIVTVAALSAGRVACIDRGGTRVIVLQIRPDDVEVLTMRNEATPAVALVAVDNETLVTLGIDGALRLLQQQNDGKGWSTGMPLSVPAAASGAPLLAGAAGWLLGVWPGLPAQLWQRSGNELLPVSLTADHQPLSTVISAIAVSEHGRCAIASGRTLWVSEATTGSSWTLSPNRPEIVALHWLDADELLVFDAEGKAARMLTRPWQESPVTEFGLPPGMRVPHALTRNCGLAVGQRDGVFVSGGAPAFFGGARAPLRALCAAGDTVFAAADAIYAFDLRRSQAGGERGPAQTVAGIRRIVVTSELALVARLDESRPGRIASLTLRRRGGAAWNVQNVGGKALPDDALLQPCVGVLALDGTLDDLDAGSHASFNDRRTILRADDPG
jgi:hypothetical protein